MKITEVLLIKKDYCKTTAKHFETTWAQQHYKVDRLYTYRTHQVLKSPKTKYTVQGSQNMSRYIILSHGSHSIRVNVEEEQNIHFSHQNNTHTIHSKQVVQFFSEISVKATVGQHHRCKKGSYR